MLERKVVFISSIISPHSCMHITNVSGSPAGRASTRTLDSSDSFYQSLKGVNQSDLSGRLRYTSPYEFYNIFIGFLYSRYVSLEAFLSWSTRLSQLV